MTSNSSKKPLHILVDADSCPVVEQIGRVAGEYDLPVILIASMDHYSAINVVAAEQVYVDSGPQAVDMAIINRLTSGDIVVTGDYGLAGLALARGAKAISPRGHIFSEKNIDRLLAERHIGAVIRKGGGRIKGPRAFTKEDKENFMAKLTTLIEGQVYPIANRC